jgi:hypothetical protein
MDINLVSGQWVEVREEATQGLIVLRSIDSDIPPARGRRHLYLEEIGLAKSGGPGSDDRVSFGKATQWYISDDQLIIEDGDWQGAYKIKEVDGIRLVLEPVN